MEGVVGEEEGDETGGVERVMKMRRDKEVEKLSPGLIGLQRVLASPEP